MAQKFASLFTILLVAIVAHDNSFYSTKIHVMAQDAVLPNLFQVDPVCDKPCNTHDDCSGALYCEACRRAVGSCGPWRSQDFQ
uniref:Metallocarboxypeptidase inhibitor-like protein n=1 Tax=Solanum habrochaites TaxID=62890 RepID=A0A089Q749_SOLHA|nr:metallocarboxypeptidase inhibitor-like protein [Solanum habrochaites]